MTPDEAVAELSTLDVKHAGDDMAIQVEAITILLMLVPDKVQQAYERLWQRLVHG